MDYNALRKSFITKVSWGPSKIGFGDAIIAFDEAMAEAGLIQEVPVHSTYSPVPDALDVPTTFTNAEDLASYVAAQSKTKKKRREDPGMELDPVQENAEALAAIAKAHS